MWQKSQIWDTFACSLNAPSPISQLWKIIEQAELLCTL